MPVGDIGRWRQIYADDFTGSSLGPDWGTYSGQPGGDPYSHWDPTHVQVKNGMLVLAGYRDNGRWVTGGVSNWPVTQTYGRWEVRFRADRSDEITYHFLLWPQADHWPPEIDFLEDLSGDRTAAAAFVHWTKDGHEQKTQRNVEADFSTWHTAGVIWEPGKVSYLLDGRVWASVTGSQVPDEPMWLGLQQEAGGCQRNADFGFPRCPRAGIPDHADVDIDWVVAYARR